jgi:hypothetical protein
MTEKRYVTWRTDGIDKAGTCEQAVRKAQSLVREGRGPVYVLEVLYVVQEATPPIEVKEF